MKKIDLKKLNWEEYQFFHSIIDTQQSLANDGVINPSYYITLKSIYLNFKKKIAQYLIKFNIGALVTSHNVYTVKTFNSIFRKKIYLFFVTLRSIYINYQKIKMKIGTISLI